MIIFEENIPPIQLMRSEYDLKVDKYRSIVNNNEDDYDFEQFIDYVDYQKVTNPDFDDYKLIKKIFNPVLTSYMVETNNFNWSYLMFVSYFFNVLINDEELNHLVEENGFSEGVLLDLILGYNGYFNPLSVVTGAIIQDTVVRQIRCFGKVQSLSNVRYQPTRSFNIYNTSNAFSNFIKNWKVLNENAKKERLNFLKKYLVVFEIADDIKISIQDNIGFIHLIKNKQTFAIIDEGSGISNILSVALVLSEAMYIGEKSRKLEIESFANNEKFIILEEPESNLHPCLQSKLANMIVEIHRLTNVNIIIETHSEYLIRKLQYLVATEEIEPSKISINYFSLEKKRGKQFIQNKPISIDNQGILSDEFGSGFYDEANNLSIDLFLLNKTQNN
jgi:hypothetical protein